MKRKINVFIAIFNLIAVLMIGCIGILTVFARLNLSPYDGENYFPRLGLSIILTFLSLFLFFAVPSIKVLFFKGNSILLLLLNAVGLLLMFFVLMFFLLIVY